MCYIMSRTKGLILGGNFCTGSSKGSLNTGNASRCNQNGVGFQARCGCWTSLILAESNSPGPALNIM